MNRFYFHICILACILFAGCSDELAYKNPELPTNARVKDLLGRMTVEEKIGQLICPYGWPMYERLSDSTATYSQAFKEYIDNQHGGMLWGLFRADPWTEKTLENGLNPRSAISAYNALQHYAMDSTRLGIPIILAEEAPHGHMAIGTTVFPTSIGLAATFDTNLMERAGNAIADELTAVGARIAYGPVIDLARELRWSRVEETYGEDPCLTSEMASGLVRGMSPLHNGWDKGVVSTLKHFVAYGTPQGGHNGYISIVGERDMYENILPIFKNCLDAGALSVMTSYNSIDGVPCTSNKTLLRDLLRDEWGFQGIVVSDLIAIDGLSGTHRIAKNGQEAGQIALEAGVDVDLGANCYPRIAELVGSGEISEKTLDEAVSRVLEMKFNLGLFDNPYMDEDGYHNVRSEKNTQAALDAARESVVLLENNGVLPLSKNMKVAVIGPNADRIYNQLGDYTAPQPDDNITTPLEGIVAKIGSKQVTYVHGCSIKDLEHENIQEAVRAARSCDVAVVFVGGSSARDFGTKYMDTGAALADGENISDMESGEGFDRSSLELMGHQQRLLEAIKATNKPMVVVYIEGRPLDKRWAKENADALLTQFYPGQAGGDAIADVLFGDYNPAGRLPISVPRTVGQLPVHYNQPFPVPNDYIDSPATPLYSFGYGLSYSSFEYESISCEKVSSDQVNVTVKITNTGEMDGDEVVQIYLTDKVASTVRPRQSLKAFQRVNIKAGETKELSFILGPESFSIYNTEMEKVIEPGEFIIKAGASSDDIRLQETIAL